ncbi:serine hydrolase [Streptomyces sp. NPDC051018]|uniref:serine hydrolase n=1 Tax=Streptomyces sp. NPDC051018 TaxID=3365639 RepID=UPI0037A017D5
MALRGIRRIRAAFVAAVVLAPAVVAVTPAEAATTPAISCTSRDIRLAFRLLVGIAGALDGRRPAVALHFDDRLRDTSCEVRADRRFDSASVVKVTVLGALLMEAKERGRTLTARESGLARAMITRSDNASTDALWQQLGTDRIDEFLNAAGMKDTDPGRGGHWGLTQITARDQSRLLRLLTTPNAVLTDASRAYVLKLMREVVPSQRWGTPAGAPATATAQVKNGWLPRAARGWRVHSVGVFTEAGHDRTIAVLTEDNATMASGVDTVEAISRALHRNL